MSRIFTALRVAAALMACVPHASGVAAQDAPDAPDAAAPQAPARAQPAPFRDFTFRRVTVAPPAEGARRITVQIDPEEQARLLAINPALPPAPDAPAAATPESGAEGIYDWFWQVVSPARTGSPGRFQAAMAALDAAPQGRGSMPPRLQELQDIAAVHGPDILRATIGTGVSPALVLAVIAVESAGRPDAQSPKGAQGLMQLIPDTAARFGVADAADPAQNIRGGVAYLDWLISRFEGDVLLALAGYNAGEGAVDRNDGVPPFAETRAYVPKVLKAWQVARGLCVTPPELPGDGCVFNVGAVASR
jgi:soluble lytic murein transglycosylase-like protein